MIKKEYKVIVAHPRCQHSFKLAVALKKDNYLFKYCTTVYKKKNSVLVKIIEFFSSHNNKKRFNGHCCEMLKDDEIFQFYEIAGLILTFLGRFHRLSFVYLQWEHIVFDLFGKAVAKYAIKNEVDAVVMYDTTATICFSVLKQRAPQIKRILDVSAANYIYMKKIYETERVISPQFFPQLYRERSYLWNNRFIQRYKSEINDANFFLIPSFFVKRSLEYSHIDPKKMYICPYGVEFLSEKYKNINSFNSMKVLNVLYIGNVLALKGIFYLLEAALDFPKEKVQLTVVGDYNTNEKNFALYKAKINFTGRIPHEDIGQYLSQADLFVFPSLGDGFGLAVLEAMGAGVPCVVTENTGACDYIVDGKNGFVIPIQDKNAIIKKIQWCLDNPSKLLQMRQEVVKHAHNITWQNYNSCISQSFEKII